jgi:hypothetical protein
MFLMRADTLGGEVGGQFSKNYRTFYPKNCHQPLKNMGLGSGKNLFRIPDPGFKKAPDPGSGSATLEDSRVHKLNGVYNSQKELFHFLAGN